MGSVKDLNVVKTATIDESGRGRFEEMDIKTVVVKSKADKDSLYIKIVDDGLELGGNRSDPVSLPPLK